jgi:hypothetical protein
MLSVVLCTCFWAWRDNYNTHFKCAHAAIVSMVYYWGLTHPPWTSEWLKLSTHRLSFCDKPWTSTFWNSSYRHLNYGTVINYKYCKKGKSDKRNNLMPAACVPCFLGSAWEGGQTEGETGGDGQGVEETRAGHGQTGQDPLLPQEM